MENAKKKIPTNIKVAGIVSNFLKEMTRKRIKEELDSVGKEELWEEIEQYAEYTTAANLYELIKD